MTPTVSLLVTPYVVMTTTYGTISDHKVGVMTTSVFNNIYSRVAGDLRRHGAHITVL